MFHYTAFDTFILAGAIAVGPLMFLGGAAMLLFGVVNTDVVCIGFGTGWVVYGLAWIMG